MKMRSVAVHIGHDSSVKPVLCSMKQIVIDIKNTTIAIVLALIWHLSSSHSSIATKLTQQSGYGFARSCTFLNPGGAPTVPHLQKKRKENKTQ